MPVARPPAGVQGACRHATGSPPEEQKAPDGAGEVGQFDFDSSLWPCQTIGK